MIPEEVLRKPAVQLRQMLDKGEFSPLDLMEATLAQIDRYNKRVNAVVTLADNARDEAKRLTENWSKKKDRGLLYGLPVGIKDVTPTAGIRTTYGCPLYADYVPDEDALVVTRVKQAGGIILGKTNTPEFATGGNTFNEVFGVTRNPWNPALSAGGSTGGGAAALAVGMIALAEGTDLGGSLRIPASFCGVTGLRPSPGLVPTYPSEYLWDNMQVTGPMARTAEDIALMLQAVAGPSPLSPVCQPTRGRNFLDAVASPSLQGAKIAYSADIAGIGIDAEVGRICRDAAQNLAQTGAKVEEIEFDLSFGWEPFLAIRGFWMVAQQYRRLDKTEQFGSNLKGNIKSGLQVSMEQLGAAEQARGKMWQLFYEFFQQYDYLITPCMAIPPFPVEQNYPATIGGKPMKTYVDWIAPTFILSLSGLPVGCVPCGLTADNLPVGMQVLGRPRDEESVLSAMAVLQQTFPIGLPGLESLKDRA